MTDGLDVSCQCGDVLVRLSGAPARRGIRFICHCDDCQIAATALGHARLLDARGGTDAVMLDSSRLSVVRGLERLAAMRLASVRSRPVLRWHCAGCRTPLFNTYDVAARSFLSVLLANADPAARDRAFGPATGHVWTKFARGGGALRQANLPAIVWRLAARQVTARMSGDYRRTPLFDPRTGGPIVAPWTLSAEARSAARASLSGAGHGVTPQ